MGKLFIHMISGEAQYFLTGCPTLAPTVKPGEKMLFLENRRIGSMFDWRINRGGGQFFYFLSPIKPNNLSDKVLSISFSMRY